MSRTKYGPERSNVIVTYTDGEVKEFTMSAGPRIAGYLMQEAARSGVMVIRDDDLAQSVGIPLAQIRHVEVMGIQDTES